MGIGQKELVFVGDWMPSRPICMRTLFKNAVAIGNLECVITNTQHVAEKAHRVVLGEQAIEIVRNSGFAALNLANNHVNDAGPEGFQRMIQSLTFGAPNVAVYGTRDKPVASLEVEGLRVGMIGCLERCRARGDNLFPIEDVTDLLRTVRSTFDRVVITPHWGKESEYSCCPSPAQLSQACIWLRNGADAVIGHHSHTIQGSLKLNQANRCYFSLGNFDFPHPEGSAYPLTDFGMAVRWQPSSHQWAEAFLSASHRGEPTRLSGKAEKIAASFFDELSQLSSETLGIAGDREVDRESREVKQWLVLSRLRTTVFPSSLTGMNWLRWARIVGRTYVGKSYRSWMKRLRNNPLAAGPRFLVWQLLPMTLLLSVGAMLPRRHADAAAESFLSRMKGV